ncbi:MAG: hypothetical protein AAF617_04975 [Bacteroidota bacterium]
MGQSGYLTLVNSTDTAWKKTYQHSYQMDVWDFPTVIEAKTSISVYIEWKQKKNSKTFNDAGEVVYALEGTNNSFEIQAAAQNGLDLQVYFSQLTTHSYQNRAQFSLGWNSKGYVSFILSGIDGHYSSTNLNGSSWMQDNIALLGTKKIKEICIPGTHHAGMNVKTSHTFGATNCNTLTQTRNIREQLQLGARFLDITPVLKDGSYYAGNYRKIEAVCSWQGATGQSIDHIIEDINAFTAVRKELVIIHVSNSLNLDAEDTMYQPFTSAEWHDLLKKLSYVKNRFFSLQKNNLTTKTLNDFIALKAAVVFVVADTVELGNYNGKGFFKLSSLQLQSSDSHTHQIAKMASNHWRNMASQPTANFLLLWILKQTTFQASTCFLGTNSSLKELANEVNQQLPEQVYSKVTATTFPNVILQNNMITSDAAAFAMALNWKIHQPIKTYNNYIKEKITD